MVAEPHGVWVYAVTERVPAESLRQLAGIGGAPVRAVAAAGLTAVAGDVPLAEFGESALRHNLEDLDWLESTARAHHHVIEAIARQSPVVPMQLATVYSGDASVAAVLAERGPDFRVVLDRTTARQEWGVKAYAAQAGRPDDRLDVGGDVVAGQPLSLGPRQMPTDVAGLGSGSGSGGSGSGSGGSRPEPGPGAAYLRRRRDELSAHKNARRDAMESANVVHAQLSRFAAESRLHPPQAPQLTGIKAQMILNAAYLLDDQRSDEFSAAVADLAERHPGVRLELTGPWPPYSFAGPLEAGDQS